MSAIWIAYFGENKIDDQVCNIIMKIYVVL